MHELTITQSIVEICTERAHGRPVKRVTLEIGSLAAIVPEAIRFCFDSCATGTALEGAELELIVVAALGRCKLCGAQTPMPSYLAQCQRCAASLECVHGGRLIIKTMELL